MASNDEWINLNETSFLKAFNPLTDLIKKRVGSNGTNYIFKNSKVQLSQGIDHYGRIKYSNEVPTKLKDDLVQNNYDIVFLHQNKSPKENYIIKLKQSDIEQKISKKMGQKEVGPVFKKTLPSPFNNKNDMFLVEEFLAYSDGWHPIYSMQKHIRKHYSSFADSFGEMMSVINNAGIMYGDDFWKHLYYNTMDQECRLIDFGSSFFSNNPDDTNYELDKVYQFIDMMFHKRSADSKKIFDSAYGLD
ncbi:MAG: hypothetical protein K0B02_03010 [DPANN group archaeon]|nr:hypothetical protein [DPANN group archaeon]